MGAILNHWVRLRSKVRIAKGLLGIRPLSAFLFEGETDFNVLSNLKLSVQSFLIIFLKNITCRELLSMLTFSVLDL